MQLQYNRAFSEVRWFSHLRVPFKNFRVWFWPNLVQRKQKNAIFSMNCANYWYWKVEIWHIMMFQLPFLLANSRFYVHLQSCINYLKLGLVWITLLNYPCATGFYVNHTTSPDYLLYSNLPHVRLWCEYPVQKRFWRHPLDRQQRLAALPVVVRPVDVSRHAKVGDLDDATRTARCE